MAINIVNEKIRSNNIDIDANYGPYESVSEAHSILLDNNKNKVGVTVGIKNDTTLTIEEYWYQGGTDQVNLEKKQSSDVEANPTGEATTTLNKIKIGETIYTVSQGSQDIETDPTVPSWAKQPNKPSYTYSEIGNTPDLSVFITKSVNDLTNYYLKSETYTKAEVDEKMVRVYKPAGNATLETLGSLDASHEGFTYNMTEGFTTTADFVEGAGKDYPAGSNVAVVNVGTVNEPVYKYDVLGGAGDNKDYEAIKEAFEFTPQSSKNLYDYATVGVVEVLVNTSGDLVTPPTLVGYATGLIPIQPNHYYYLSGRVKHVAKSVRCLASDKTTHMKVLAVNGEEYSTYAFPNIDATDTADNGQFKTPANAAYIQINLTPTNTETLGDYYKIMLEDVGDAYDPNFVPSAYEPYNPSGEQTATLKDENLQYPVAALMEQTAEAGVNALAALRRKFKVKLLLVGSSHGMNTIAQLPFIAYKSGIDIEVGNVYIGSFSLQRLVGMNERNEKCAFKYFKDGVWTTYSNLSFSQVFSYADWDFISVQRSATDDELWLNTQNEADTTHNSMTNINYNTDLPAVYMSHNEALQYVLNLIRINATKNPEVIFNSGFADPSEGLNPTQTNNIISTAKDMKAQFGIDYVPVAIAVRNARNTYLRHYGNYIASNANATNQLCYDGQHLDYGIGCYVPSICLLEFVCRKVGWSTINLKGYGTQAEVGSFISLALTDANYTEPTDETMIVAKACAMCACDTPDTPSTKLSDRFKWQIAYNLSNDITASNTKGYCGNLDAYSTTLSGTISSVVITSKPWDRAQPSTTLVEGTDYTYDSSTGKIVIGSVQGDITITAN